MAENVMNKEFMKSTLNLYNIYQIPRSAVSNVIHEVERVISESLIPVLNEGIQNMIKEHCPPEICGAVALFMESSKYPLKSFKTEHLCFEAYKKSNLFVEPECFQIGKENVFETDSLGKSNISKVPRYAVYIPLRQSSKCLLEKPGLFDKIQKYKTALSNETREITNIMQGELWQNKYAAKQNNFPLNLFSDDFETGNALGSHSGQQKLLGVYVSLPFLPPDLAHKVEYILLNTIAYTKYVKLFGNYAIFSKVIEELNSLQQHALQLMINGEMKMVYFQLFLVLGDNLGLNCTCGFAESFNSLRYCRICTATSRMCKSMCVVDEDLIRTKTDYDDLMNSGSGLSSGIKEECVFNNVQHFHITENKALDIMHDVCEGVIPYTIGNILTVFIEKEKLFSLVELNDEVNKFNFGPFEKNRPRPFAMEYNQDNTNIAGSKKKIKFKQSAAESLCLCRYLGLIIGHKISKENIYWKLYLTVRQIIDIITAPRFIQADLYNVRRLIKKHNSQYLKLFGDLKPKMHFLLHFFENMKLNGPPIHYWSMPMERKNKHMKNFSISTSSHINLPLTIAIRNQLQIAHSQQHSEDLSTNIELGSIPNNVDLQINDVVPEIPYAKTYKYVTIGGKTYKPGMVKIVRVNNEEGPVMRTICKIYVINGNVYYLLNDINIVSFESHSHAYMVELSNEVVELINVLMLPTMCPPCLLTEKNGVNYVGTRYQV